MICLSHIVCLPCSVCFGYILYSQEDSAIFKSNAVNFKICTLLKLYSSDKLVTLDVQRVYAIKSRLCCGIVFLWMSVAVKKSRLVLIISCYVILSLCVAILLVIVSIC